VQILNDDYYFGSDFILFFRSLRPGHQTDINDADLNVAVRELHSLVRFAFYCGGSTAIYAGVYLSADSMCLCDNSFPTTLRL
jgi:hypothetical protein